MLEKCINHSFCWNKKPLHETLGPESNLKKRGGGGGGGGGGGRDLNFTKQIKMYSYSLAILYKKCALV